jgi:hypothetical protein
MFVPLKSSELLNVMESIAFTNIKNNEEIDYTEIALLYLMDQYEEIYQIIMEKINNNDKKCRILFNKTIYGKYVEYFTNSDIYITFPVECDFDTNDFNISTSYNNNYDNILLEPYNPC